MKNTILLTLVLFFLIRSESAIAQLDYSMGFVNIKRSLTSNFANVEFEIGNSDDMHFLTIQAGINVSNYSSAKYCPYYTGTIDLNQFYKFSNYKSSKKGVQAGIGYLYYFKNLENEKEFIPMIGFDFWWLRNRDQYIITYTHEGNGDQQSLPEKNTNFTTVACEVNYGFIYTSEKILFKGSIGLGYYLPVNTHAYMATDEYNIYSSRKLPLAGLEPTIQVGIGFRL